MDPTPVCHVHDEHELTLRQEIVHHLPYAVFSVAFGLIVLSFFDALFMPVSKQMAHDKLDMLFHSFHFLHIIFAATGALIAFSRYSNQLIVGLLTASGTALTFCTLSDVVIPYLSGRLLGTHMDMHICFFSELHNVIPFVFVGLINGMVLSRHRSTIQGFYSVTSHFAHIFISSLASLFYLIGHGLSDWYPKMGFLFVFLVIAVVVPCTLSDVIVPIWFARSAKRGKKE